jgi:hypothetical protein
VRSRGSSPSSPPTAAPNPTAEPTTLLIDELLTVEQVAKLLQCKPSSIYNLTRTRAASRYAHPLPVMRLPVRSALQPYSN